MWDSPESFPLSSRWADQRPAGVERQAPDIPAFTIGRRSLDGKTYKSYPWSTPVRSYKDFDGRRVAGYGEAVWHTPEGEFS